MIWLLPNSIAYLLTRLFGLLKTDPPQLPIYLTNSKQHNSHHFLIAAAASVPDRSCFLPALPSRNNHVVFKLMCGARCVTNHCMASNRNFLRSGFFYEKSRTKRLEERTARPSNSQIPRREEDCKKTLNTLRPVQYTSGNSSDASKHLKYTFEFELYALLT